MLDLNYIRKYPEKFTELMEKRNVVISVKNILDLDKDKKLKITELQELQTERNTISKLIGVYRKEKKDTIDLERKVTKIKNASSKIESTLNNIEGKLNEIILSLPNLPDEDVPIGENEDYNIELLKKFEPPKFKFKPISHDLIGKNINNMMDFDLGALISGSEQIDTVLIPIL